MKKIHIPLAALIFIGIAFFARPILAQNSSEKGTTEKVENEEEHEEAIAIDEVPAEILAVLKKVAPGFIASEVERETEGDEVSYTFEGKSGNYEVEIEIGLDDDDDDEK